MTLPTSAEIKATLLASWKDYWPVFITLLFTYLGWLALCRDDGYFVQAVGAAGVIIFLPLFKLQKNIWLYVTVFFLSGADEMWPEGAQWVAAFMGFEALHTWTASTVSAVILSVQGAAISFVCLLLVCVHFQVARQRRIVVQGANLRVLFACSADPRIFFPLATFERHRDFWASCFVVYKKQVLHDIPNKRGNKSKYAS